MESMGGRYNLCECGNKKYILSKKCKKCYIKNKGGNLGHLNKYNPITKEWEYRGKNKRKNGKNR